MQQNFHIYYQALIFIKLHTFSVDIINFLVQYYKQGVQKILDIFTLNLVAISLYKRRAYIADEVERGTVVWGSFFVQLQLLFYIWYFGLLYTVQISFLYTSNFFQQNFLLMQTVNIPIKCTLCQGHYDFSFSDFYFIFVCCVEASK